MKLKKKAMAGTLESSDCMITIEPQSSGGVIVDVESIVKPQFGTQIEAVIKNVLAQLNITDATVAINDKGALDCVIEARLNAAILRSSEEEAFEWRCGQ